MNGPLGHDSALLRLYWAGDNLGEHNMGWNNGMQYLHQNKLQYADVIILYPVRPGVI